MVALGDRYLVRKRDRYWFRRAIPAAARPAFGGQTTFFINLETSDIRVAKRRRDEAAPKVEAEFRRALLEGNRRAEAPILRDVDYFARSRDEDDGEPDGLNAGAGPREAAQERIAEHDAEFGTSFGDRAHGRSPIDEPLEEHLSESSLTEKTKAERRRDVKELAEFASKQGHSLPSMPRRSAALFFTSRIIPLHRESAAKKLSHLRVYWKWLLERGYADGENHWKALDLPTESSRQKVARREAEERAFTTEEMRVLLYGAPPETMRDLGRLNDAMRVAALSGLRIEEMVRLTVADCAGDFFAVRVGKTESATRRVPIHPDLRGIVKRRLKGKGPADRLFSDVAGQGASLADPLSKQFGRFIRQMKVADLREGHRRSKVNFHSFRRWFVTEAERADQPPTTISAVVGHAEGRGGMTLGRYSAGPSDEQLRRVVESVKLPSQKKTGA